MLISSNTTIYQVVCCLLYVKHNYMFWPQMLPIFRLYNENLSICYTCVCTEFIIKIITILYDKIITVHDCVIMHCSKFENTSRHLAQSRISRWNSSVYRLLRSRKPCCIQQQICKNMPLPGCSIFLTLSHYDAKCWSLKRTVTWPCHMLVSVCLLGSNLKSTLCQKNSGHPNMKFTMKSAP